MTNKVEAVDMIAAINAASPIPPSTGGTWFKKATIITRSEGSMPGSITCMPPAARKTGICMAEARKTPIRVAFITTKSFLAGNTRDTSAGVQVKNITQTRNCEMVNPIGLSAAPPMVQNPGITSDKPRNSVNPALPMIQGATTPETASIIKNMIVSVTTTPYIPPNSENASKAKTKVMMINEKLSPVNSSSSRPAPIS